MWSIAGWILAAGLCAPCCADDALHTPRLPDKRLPGCRCPIPVSQTSAHNCGRRTAGAHSKPAAEVPDAELRAPPHWGIFPAVTPPDWDASSTGVNDVWRMEIDVKSLWNGAASLDDAAAKTSALHKSLSSMLQEEKWAVVSVCEGVMTLACKSNDVDWRGYLSQHMDFGVWPEVRRVKCAADRKRAGVRVDDTLPYTLADEQLRRAHGLVPAEQLDDMLGMRSVAHEAAARVLRRFTAEAAAESNGAVQVTEQDGILQVHKTPQKPDSATKSP